MIPSTKKWEFNKSVRLIALCWLVYACSYIGKLSYSANINQIGTAFGASYSETGLISTCFFFMYGIGQVVNGFMCKKYNVKYVVFSALLVSSAMNLLLVNVPDLSVMKYLWLINGASMSFLWTSLVRLLSETLADEYMDKAVFAMGTTVASGTFIVYGLSSLFAAVGNFKLTFYVAAALMTLTAIIWIVSYSGLTEPLRAERAACDWEMVEDIGVEQKRGGRLGFIIAVLAVFAVTNNFVKDGLTAWTPDILSSLYDTPGWLSILLTLLLPVMAIGGSAIALRLHKKIKDFVGLCSALFGASAVLVGVVILLLEVDALPVTIACFAVVSCLMAGVNNVITSMVPLSLKNELNSGKLAGILNGFCYLGSTVSSYGLGAIADGFGWSAVFTTLLSATVATVLLGGAYLILNYKEKDRKI